LFPAITAGTDAICQNWFFINIYEMSSWTRGIVIPMQFERPEADWRWPEQPSGWRLKDPSPQRRHLTGRTARFLEEFLSALDRALKIL